MLSQELCGLDHVLGMRDPGDPSRPRIEVINLSIGQWLAGADDRDCGRPSGDLVHGAICALVADGTTVVAAAGNESVSTVTRQPAGYDEVITVSALADFDGRPGGQGRQARHLSLVQPGHRRYLRELQQLRAGRGPHRSRQVHPVDGARRLVRVVHGHLHGDAPCHGRGRPARRRASRRDARARSRPPCVGAATLDWNTRTDPDARPDPLLDVSRLRGLPDFPLRPPDADRRARAGRGDTHRCDHRASGWPPGPGGGARAGPAGRALRAEVAPSPTTGDAVTVWLRAGGGAPDGPLAITIRATDGDLVRSATVTVRVRARRPHDRVQRTRRRRGRPAHHRRRPRRRSRSWSRRPASGRRSAASCARRGDAGRPGQLRGRGLVARRGGGDARASWTRRVARDRLGVHALTSPIDGCTRWLVRLIDADGGSARFASPAVLRDTSRTLRRPVVRVGRRLARAAGARRSGSAAGRAG